MTYVNKDDIIKNIYFDRSGFGSVQTTYQDAKKKEPSITLNDVKEWFKKNVEVKRKQRGFNSFVAPYNSHTYQIDLFFMGKTDFENKQKFRAGLVLIDVLSKYAVVVPIKSKDGPDVIAGTMEALNKMKEKPSLKGLLEPLRICFSKELKLMKRKARRIYNGLIIFLKLCLLIMIKWFIPLLI